MKTIISFILLFLLGFFAKGQTYRFVVDSFPTITPIDTIDKSYITSLDTSEMIEIFKGGLREVDSQGRTLQEYKNQKNHVIGKFHKSGYCWALIVTDFFDNGTNASRFIHLTIYDNDGNVIGGHPIGQYADLVHTQLIKDCYFFDDGFKVVNASKSTRFEMTDEEEKIFKIENNSLIQKK